MDILQSHVCSYHRCSFIRPCMNECTRMTKSCEYHFKPSAVSPNKRVSAQDLQQLALLHCHISSLHACTSPDHITCTSPDHITCTSPDHTNHLYMYLSQLQYSSTLYTFIRSYMIECLQSFAAFRAPLDQYLKRLLIRYADMVSYWHCSAMGWCQIGTVVQWDGVGSAL